MKFTKLHGCGNDYLYFDCITQPAPANPENIARLISDRHFGVGSDGLILALPSDRADVRMRMFNADGSEGEMCGNGIRGLAKFVLDRGLSKQNPMRIETLRGVLMIHQFVGEEGTVTSSTVDMDEPILDLTRIGVRADWVTPAGAAHEFCLAGQVGAAPAGPTTFVSMGSDHAVIFVDHLDAIDLPTRGPLVETHPAFPKRINAHWVQVSSRGAVTMKTWERGSGMTLACGTGACAVVVAGVITGRLDRSVLVHLPGGDLNVEWREANNHVYMTGPAVEVFSGEWPITADIVQSAIRNP